MKPLPELLHNRLKLGLPGDSAHQKMMSYRRTKASDLRRDGIEYRESAVLCLLYPVKDEWNTVLIKRPEYIGAHSAQVSFPGGGREKHDLSIIQTALRETREEIGVNEQDITIIGNLTEIFIPPSKYLVQPVLGFMNQRPDFVPDYREVGAILETPINWLLDENRIATKQIHIAQYNISIMAPYYDIHSETVWGATAMMISELVQLIRTAED